MAAAAHSPLPTSELQQIATQACESVIGAAEEYDHTKSGEWNTDLIQTVLKNLIEKTSTTTASGETSQPPYKYIVNSTLIQHIGHPSEPDKHGRRGMHSAVGAYWNNEKDGTYSFKWEGAEKKGMEVVIAITWVSI